MPAFFVGRDEFAVGEEFEVMGDRWLCQVDLGVEVDAVQAIPAFLDLLKDGQPVGVGQRFRDLFCFLRIHVTLFYGTKVRDLLKYFDK